MRREGADVVAPEIAFGGNEGEDGVGVFEGSLCGAAAANLSLNIIEDWTVSGFDKTGAGAATDANTSLKAGVAGRAATATGRLMTGASNAALFTDG